MIYEIIKFMAFGGCSILIDNNLAVTDLYVQTAPSAFVVYNHYALIPE